MLRLDALMRDKPGYSLPTQYRLGAPGQTVLCFHNFYEQLFPGQDTPVDLHVLAFAEDGSQVHGETLRVATGEAVQYSAAAADARGSGMIAAMAVPAFDLAQINAGRLRIRSEIGTGFYVIWKDARGRLDTMHEWMPVRATAGGESRYFFVFDAARHLLARVGLVLTNPCCARGADATGTLALYDRAGTVLGRERLPAVPPMGSKLVYLDELFPDARTWFERHGALGARIDGVNLVEPLTAEFHQSGDLHLHHIN
ncbi:MAG TPA: hypothetical protein VHP37_26975 [Burkholderiales bacterium]|nr:hypothetical protein [Burkholderiales bacterium]